MSKISFITNNILFSQWSRVNVFKSMNTISGELTLTTPDFYKGKPKSWSMYVGDEYELKIDDVSFSKGIIDKIVPSYGMASNNKSYYNYTVMCRDKTSSLIDTVYDKDENEWVNETVLNIIKRLCSAYSLEVTNETAVAPEVSKKIDSFKHNEGEYTINSIVRLTNEIGVLPISYGDGKLTLIKGTADKLTTDAIHVGANVKEVKAIHSNTNRFSSYTVKGVGIGNDNKQLTDFIQPYGSASDGVISSYRPMVIFSDVPTDSGKCQTKAKWERNIRAGNSRKRIYRLYTLQQSDGSFWNINRLVRVKDWFADLDELRLISEMDYRYDSEKGSSCYLTVVHKDTYSVSDVDIKGEFDR